MRTYTRIRGEWAPSVPDTAAMVAFLQRYGFIGLSGSDGCLCAHIMLAGISVDVSCRKSEHSVRVTCSGFDSQATCIPVANEVMDQIADYGQDATDYTVRFCDYKQDHPSVCCWCGKPRRDAAAYLCDSCQLNDDALARYPASLLAYAWTGTPQADR